jgi:protease I
MELRAKRVAILVEDLYQDLEVWYPLLRLKEAGADVVVVGTGKQVYKSKHGYEIAAQADVHRLRPEDFDGVIIPGGYAPDILRRFPAVNSFVAKVFERGKVVSSICHGAWVLVSSGILKGRTVTCFFAIKDDVINAGARYLDQEVVTDGNLVTSRKPEDLPAFMSQTIRLLMET